MVNNFVMGGKLGDFIQSMFAVKQICTQYKIKANLYIYDFGWEFGVKNTYKELLPIILEQNYIESFQILNEFEIDSIQTPENNSPVKIKNNKLLSEGYIDLGNYIRSPWLYKNCWSEIYSKTFNFKISGDYLWIKWNKINTDLVDKVLIHRRFNPVRINKDFPYAEIIDEYKDNVLFISSSDKDYEEFNYSKIPFLKIKTLEDWFTSINSCFLFISNLSAPAAMSHALDKLRIIELPNIIDSRHCVGEERYSKNVKWFISQQYHNI